MNCRPYKADRGGKAADNFINTATATQQGADNSRKIHSPWMGDIVDSGIGLEYRAACLCNVAWWAGTTTLYNFFPLSQGLWI